MHAGRSLREGPSAGIKRVARALCHCTAPGRLEAAQTPSPRPPTRKTDTSERGSLGRLLAPAEPPPCPGPAQRRAPAGVQRRGEHSSVHGNSRPRTLFTSQNQLPPASTCKTELTLKGGKGEERNPEMPVTSYLVSLFLSADRCYRLGSHFPSHMQSTLKREKHINQLAGVSAQDPRPAVAKRWVQRKRPPLRAPAEAQSTQTWSARHTSLSPHGSAVCRLTWEGASGVAHSNLPRQGPSGGSHGRGSTSNPSFQPEGLAIHLHGPLCSSVNTVSNTLTGFLVPDAPEHGVRDQAPERQQHTGTCAPPAGRPSRLGGEHRAATARPSRRWT